ncbi:PP2C family protein-serine/threonine phosphatase [Microbacterium sp. ABRD28]|uniref:PP2C family protein-serine/threonine phosphatase n=1 Tax=Microbacterium sp. ABRD28 TaxID=2268461 RepID=UPI000F558E74|nr:PP2C family protein-serine/threonine phosphatase [Microbacterium sp. ABRD28]AZC14431.1 serine/threonine-protein phosphatase [Microbacterium sp. ABRD28]
MTLLAPAPPAAAWDDPITQAARVQSALATSSHQRAAGTAAAGDVRNLSGVGGDFVDVLRVDEHLIAVLGDVSGKGVAASLLAAMALGSLQHHAQDLGPNPARILRAVSSSMRGALDRTSSIITLAIVAVDTRAGLVRLVSAGHHPIMRVDRGRVSHVAATCPPMGVDVGGSVERAWDRGTGSALVVVSDGVVDQEDPNGSPLGLAGLATALRSTPTSDPSVIVARTFDALENHAGWMPAVDDRAVLAIVT